jgi:hypothetical protein
MAIDFNNDVVAGTVLVRSAIQSPNYSAGSAGWTVNQNGSAEFNNVTIRGGESISGTALYYSGTPALGNLVLSISATAGVDSFGNIYPAGLTVGMPGAPQIELFTNSGSAILQLPTASANEDNAAAIFAATFPGTTGNSLFQLTGPTANARADLYKIAIGSSSYDGTTSTADLTFYYVAAGGATTATLTCNSAGNAVVNGAILKGSNGTPYTKQNPTLGSGWANSAIRSANPLQYWLDGNDRLCVEGNVNTTSTSPTTTVFSVPSGAPYTPASGFTLQNHWAIQMSSAGSYKAMGHVFLSTSGINVNGFTFASGDIIGFASRFPLGYTA